MCGGLPEQSLLHDALHRGRELRESERSLLQRKTHLRRSACVRALRESIDPARGFRSSAASPHPLAGKPFAVAEARCRPGRAGAEALPAR